MILIVRIIGVSLIAYYAYQCYLIGGKDIPLPYFGGFMAGFAFMGAPMAFESIFKEILGWISTFTGILLFVNSNNPDEGLINLYFILGIAFYFIGLSLLGFETGDDGSDGGDVY
jgi:hypothetical protein